MSKSFEQFCDEASKFFTKSNPRGVVAFTDDRPQWLWNAVYEAHRDMMPDDFVFATARACLEQLAESGDDEVCGMEFADQQVDVYNRDLLNWVGSHLERAAFVEEAISDGLCDGADFYKSLACGQYLEIQGIYNALRQSALDAFEESEAEAA